MSLTWHFCHSSAEVAPEKHSWGGEGRRDSRIHRLLPHVHLQGMGFSKETFKELTSGTFFRGTSPTMQT